MLAYFKDFLLALFFFFVFGPHTNGQTPYMLSHLSGLYYIFLCWWPFQMNSIIVSSLNIFGYSINILITKCVILFYRQLCMKQDILCHLPLNLKYILLVSGPQRNSALSLSMASTQRMQRTELSTAFYEESMRIKNTNQLYIEIIEAGIHWTYIFFHWFVYGGHTQKCLKLTPCKCSGIILRDAQDNMGGLLAVNNKYFTYLLSHWPLKESLSYYISINIQSLLVRSLKYL